MGSVALVILVVSMGCAGLTVRPGDSLGSKVAKHSARLVMTVGTVGVAGFMQDDLDDRIAVEEGRMSMEMYQVRSRNRAIVGAALINAASRPAPVPRTYTCYTDQQGTTFCQ